VVLSVARLESGRVYRVRRQFYLSAASLGAAAGADLGLMAARGRGAEYIFVFVGLTVLASVPLSIISSKLGRRLVESAKPASPGWAPGAGGLLAWVVVAPLPAVFVVALSLAGWLADGTTFIALTLLAIGFLVQGRSLGRTEGDLDLVLVSKSWHGGGVVSMSASDLARLESGRAASGAAR
jgi:hypothetical protein